ncbi:MAG: polyprenyl synthetase family protein [Acidobacteriaceae bacterium]
MSTLTIATAKEVFDLVRDDLHAIEQDFEQSCVSDISSIMEIAEYLRAGGGKRIRPSLLLLAAKSLGYKGTSAVRMGAVVEMVHSATLVHDDIIDEADMRRGRPSPNKKWGSSKCVLTGDWLYMQAFRMALDERNFRILDLLINLTQQMVEGELLQIELQGHAIQEQEYYELIYRKTACLFCVCMQLGCVLAGAAPEVEEQMGEYGRNLGLAFQVVDDVLDLTATEEVLGKPTASDLREGKATLAVVHALENGTAEDRAAIHAVLEDRSFRRVSHERILDILHRNGSMDYAMQAAYAYAEAARAAAAILPESEYKRALLWVPDFVVAREK